MNYLWMNLLFIISLSLIFSCGNQEHTTNNSINPGDSVDLSNKQPSIPTDTTPPVETKKKLTDADRYFEKIKKEKIKVLFHGFGTEPFWDIFITEDKLLYSSLVEDNELFSLKNSFNKASRDQTIEYSNDLGDLFSVRIKKEVGSDGMSNRNYPYTVIFSESEPWLNGAGDCKLLHELRE